MYKNILSVIGSTPMVELSGRTNKTAAKIFLKLESYNPGGSIKDRVALYMIQSAERSGVLKTGGTIIEPTSGNTGIGLAVAAAVKGYKLILVMPDTMSVERRKLAQAFGAEVVLTSGCEGMKGSIKKAEELYKSIPGSFIPQQFENPANVQAHEETTGPEIWDMCNGKIDVFVAGVGTGGTLTGVGKYLKSRNEKIEIVAVEPNDSPLLSKGHAGVHKLQGIGANFVPKILDKSIISRVVAVADKDACEISRQLAKTEGILCGISSGAAVWAALNIAEAKEYANKNIVVILPDSGERYLSTWLFE